MKKGNKKRNDAQLAYDREYAIYYWSKGYTLMDIAIMLTKDHVDRGEEYSITYGQVRHDIQDIIKDSKKSREDSGVSELEELVQRSNFLYKEACTQQRITGSPLFMSIASKQIDQLAKLKGLAPDKVEIELKYDITID